MRAECKGMNWLRSDTHTFVLDSLSSIFLFSSLSSSLSELGGIFLIHGIPCPIRWGQMENEIWASRLLSWDWGLEWWVWKQVHSLSSWDSFLISLLLLSLRLPSTWNDLGIEWKLLSLSPYWDWVLFLLSETSLFAPSRGAYLFPSSLDEGGFVGSEEPIDSGFPSLGDFLPPHLQEKKGNGLIFS